MAVYHATLTTRRGDELVAILMDDPGASPSLVLTIGDADLSPLPCAELTLAEVGELREMLRGLCESAVRSGSR